MGLMYCMSKGAIEQLVRILSKDLGARGITVNAISPSAVDTPLFRAGKPPQMIKWIATLNPQNRIPLPEEISPMVAFLASDEARWINGQTIGVNGVRNCVNYIRLDSEVSAGFRCIIFVVYVSFLLYPVFLCILLLSNHSTSTISVIFVHTFVSLSGTLHALIVGQKRFRVNAIQ